MISKSLIAASSRPLILGILRGGKSYGYLIIQKVKELSGGVLEWSDGMLYPVLHRLEKEGLIVSEWILSEEGRPRKYYSITDQGKKELFKEKEQWMNVHGVLNKIWLAMN
jgi:PadR family transcriptional regulator PadR